MTSLMSAPRSHTDADPGPRRASSRVRRLFLRDYRAGWLDGRRGLPIITSAPAPERPEIVPSGHLLGTWALAGQRMDQRWRALVAQTADDRVEHASTDPRRQALTNRLADDRARLAQLQETGPAAIRRMGESALPESQVTRRRERELERRLRQQRREIRASLDELAGLETRQLALAARLEVALTAAQGDAAVIGADADRRVASYLKGACRTHPDPQSVVAATAVLRRADPDWMGLQSAHDLISTVKGNDQ